jgi:prephenate dehydratase
VDGSRARARGAPVTRAAYLGPEGTNSHEALLAAAGRAGVACEPVSMGTIQDCVTAVQDGRVERAFVPIENALEGSVNATLDALAVEADDVTIVGEHVHAIHTCLIAQRPLALGAVETVVSHPQSLGQCARFLRTRLPQASVLAASSTAEAVRRVAEQGGATAALGSRTAAELYGCELLCADVDDAAGNETRFVWLARRGAAAPPAGSGPFKTAVVFWGVGAEAPGWLVRCLAEFASREVNLTRIESRPRKQGLGRYMFFVDLEGPASEGPVAEALAALGAHVEHLRVLGSFPAA